MPRIARAVAEEVPHHVTQRGNDRQDIFFVDDDRLVYLELLKAQAQRFGLRLWGYCLMNNHVHLIGVPGREDSLAKAVGRTHWLYARYLNRLHGRSGHLWQNRFHSCPLDDAHLMAALSYVDRNPVRAKMVRRAWRYKWSSAQAHRNGEDVLGLLDKQVWQFVSEATQWSTLLSRPEDEEVLRKVRLHTRTGRPLGSDSFVSKLETLLGCRLRPMSIGRPRKAQRIKKEKPRRKR